MTGMQHKVLKEDEKKADEEKSGVSKEESVAKQKNEKQEVEGRVTTIENKVYVVPAL